MLSLCQFAANFATASDHLQAFTMNLRDTTVMAPFLATAVAQSIPNSCASVVPTIGDGLQKFYDPVRISPGLVCNADNAEDNDPCSLQSWAYITFSTRLNVTVSEDARSALIETLSFGEWDPIVLGKDGKNGIVANETWQVPVGKSAYVQFEEEYSCRAALINDCAGILAPFNGTYVEACYPIYNTGSGTIPMFYSESSLVYVDAETAAGMTDHPYGANNTGLGANEPYTGSNSTNGCEAIGEPDQQEGNGAALSGLSSFALAVLGLGMVLELL